MVSIKALLKRLTGLRGGRYDFVNYVKLTPSTSAQIAPKDGLLMVSISNPGDTLAILYVGDAPAGTSTPSDLMSTALAFYAISSGRLAACAPIAKGNSYRFHALPSNADLVSLRFIPWVEK